MIIKDVQDLFKLTEKLCAGGIWYQTEIIVINGPDQSLSIYLHEMIKISFFLKTTACARELPFDDRILMTLESIRKRHFRI